MRCQYYQKYTVLDLRLHCVKTYLARPQCSSCTWIPIILRLHVMLHIDGEIFNFSSISNYIKYFVLECRDWTSTFTSNRGKVCQLWKEPFSLSIYKCHKNSKPISWHKYKKKIDSRQEKEEKKKRGKEGRRKGRRKEGGREGEKEGRKNI